MLIAVSDPNVITSFPQWEIILANNMQEYKRPPAALNGLEFIGGKEGSSFGGSTSIAMLKLLPELERESKAADGKVVWRKQVSKKDDQPLIFTTIYRNDHQDEVYLSIELIEQKMDFSWISMVLRRIILIPNHFFSVILIGIRKFNG